MKILYDFQIFQLQNIGGISRYFSELIKHNANAELSLKYSDNIYLHEKYFKKYNISPNKNYEHGDIFPNLNFKGKGRLLKYCNKFFKTNNKDNFAISIEHIKKLNYDIFHPTYYYTYFLPYLKNTPFVLTVHDMIHELFPHYFPDDKETIPNKRELILQSSKIIAISENTKRDILRFFPEINEEKITVIYHGSSFPHLNNDTKKESFILFTGTRALYKNFESFVHAVAPLLIKYDLRLVCAGHPFNHEEQTLLDNLHISGRTACKFVSEIKLAELYAKASAFVFPSLYEGFGIPVLEAFEAGCPAILSNSSSLPEIGGEAAVYFDPYSITDMRNQIERVICSPDLKNELIKKGKERVKLFSWEKCAKETSDIYKSLLKSG